MINLQLTTLEKTNNKNHLLQLLLPLFFCLTGIAALFIFQLQKGAALPGDIMDGRFNHYVLEHFFQWLQHPLTTNYWDADFFYPYPKVIAFSDNLLGSAWIYAIFRYFDLSIYTAYQGWYLCGYLTSFFATYYVLRKLNFHPLSSSVGAFIFAFAMPVFFQSGHVQLLYRFGIPFACLALLQFAENPKLKYVVHLAFWTIIQFYLGIYNGIFLILLLVVLVIALSIYHSERKWRVMLAYWSTKIKQAWYAETPTRRLFYICCLLGLFISLLALLYPYYWVSQTYGFQRSYGEINTMLPRISSYLLAENSFLWRWLGPYIHDIPMRHEHQIFIGLGTVLLCLYALFAYKNNNEKRLTFVAVTTLFILFTLTLYLSGNSLYVIIAKLPGFSSVRAVTRIVLVMLFMLAILAAIGIEVLWRQKKFAPMMMACSIIILIMVESLYVNMHAFSYSKDEAQARLMALQSRLPTNLSANNIIYVSSLKENEPTRINLDLMHFTQQHGYKTANGYSGNFPNSFDSTTCRSIPSLAFAASKFSGVKNPTNADYVEAMRNIIPIDFIDCNPSWWSTMPPMTYADERLPDADNIAKNIEMNLKRVEVFGNKILLNLSIINHNDISLPGVPDSKYPIRIAWRYLNDSLEPISDWNRHNIWFDLLPQSEYTYSIFTPIPPLPGIYGVEFTMLQEKQFWFYDLGMEIYKPNIKINKESSGKITIF